MVLRKILLLVMGVTLISQSFIAPDLAYAARKKRPQREKKEQSPAARKGTRGSEISSEEEILATVNCSVRPDGSVTQQGSPRRTVRQQTAPNVCDQTLASSSNQQRTFLQLAKKFMVQIVSYSPAVATAAGTAVFLAPLPLIAYEAATNHRPQQYFRACAHLAGALLGWEGGKRWICSRIIPKAPEEPPAEQPKPTRKKRRR